MGQPDLIIIVNDVVLHIKGNEYNNDYDLFPLIVERYYEDDSNRRLTDNDNCEIQDIKIIRAEYLFYKIKEFNLLEKCKQKWKELWKIANNNRGSYFGDDLYYNMKEIDERIDK